MSREAGLYRQDYCGGAFTERTEDTMAKRGHGRGHDEKG